MSLKLQQKSMSEPHLMTMPKNSAPCVTLIGMAGAGKSTVGACLARELDWAFMDSDSLIEAIYGARLQDITDAMGKDDFLDVESVVIRAIRASRTIIATGGSVVYRADAVEHLKKLGPIIHLEVPLATISERIAINPERGLAIAPGQTLADIFAERQNLYQQATSLHCPAATKNPAQCVDWIIKKLPPEVLAG